jgi:hypothetical protein
MYEEMTTKDGLFVKRRKRRKRKYNGRGFFVYYHSPTENEVVEFKQAKEQYDKDKLGSIFLH